MWTKARPQDLHRVSDRVSTVYVAMSHVDRADNGIVIVNKTRKVRVPAALVGAVLLGPGTRITHAAVSLLADSGTSVCWVGADSVRMYAAGLGTSRSSGLILRQAFLVSRTKERLDVARRMYGMRFPGEDVSGCTMQQLRGREGARMKKVYRQQSARTGVTWSGRKYVAGDGGESGDEVNSLLSAGHACLYAACHAAIVGVGASPALGFVHTGLAHSFVLDIADLYKAEITIPLAFDLAAENLTEESDMRHAVRQRFADGSFMKRVVSDVVSLLAGDEVENGDVNHLWDEEVGLVSGGTDWSDEALDELTETGFLKVVGPDLEGQQ